MEKPPITKKVDAQELQVALAEFTYKISQFFKAEITNAQARETGFVERESKLTGHLFLAIFTFGMSVYGTPSLNELVGLLNLVIPQLNITRQALHERINAEAVTFFEKMLSFAVRVELPKHLSQALETLCPRFKRILILDSTAFQLPQELAPYFRGAGGGGSEAAVKILFGYDFKSGQFFYRLQDGASHDQAHQQEYIQQFQAEDLEISDLGFFNIQTFADIDDKGAFYLSRLRPDVTLYRQTPEGFEEFDLIRFIKKQPVNPIEVEVYLKKDARMLKTRLVIDKVPDNIKAQRLRKINQSSCKKGFQRRQRIKFLAGFNLYITNAPDTAIPNAQIRSLYGIRWQIELIFKSWKSNFTLAKVTGKRPERVKCMLYAKLLFIFITTKITGAIQNYVWLTSQREISGFQVAKYFKIVAPLWLETIIQHPEGLSELLKNAMAFTMKHCLKGKSKKRTYPLALLTKIYPA